MLRIAATLALYSVPTLAQALSVLQAADLFNEIRADLPCLENVETVANRFGLAATGNNETTDEIRMVEYGSEDSNSFLLVSWDVGKDAPQNAVSVSVYNTGQDFPPELANAFAEIWNLPVPEPLRDDPDLAQMYWKVSFPNGPMHVVVSFGRDTGLTQIYARTLDLTEERINACIG